MTGARYYAINNTKPGYHTLYRQDVFYFQLFGIALSEADRYDFYPHANKCPDAAWEGLPATAPPMQEGVGHQVIHYQHRLPAGQYTVCYKWRGYEYVQIGVPLTVLGPRMYHTNPSPPVCGPAKRVGERLTAGGGPTPPLSPCNASSRPKHVSRGLWLRMPCIACSLFAVLPHRSKRLRLTTVGGGGFGPDPPPPLDPPPPIELTASTQKPPGPCSRPFWNASGDRNCYRNFTAFYRNFFRGGQHPPPQEECYVQGP